MFLNSATESEMGMASLLRVLVNDFGSSPVANGRRMRDLIQLNADEFQRAAVTLLRGETDRKGCRYLLTLLWTHDLLLPILSGPSLPLDRALAAAQVAAEIDPQLHIRISRYLVVNTLEQQSIHEKEATKLLQILGSINDSSSLQPFVRQMLLHPSPRIRSKLSVLIGRNQSGNRSLEILLADSDARVRANAVEALWNNGSPQISDLIRTALDDKNNRVVGNALLGLYLAGDTTSIKAAIKLASHADPLFCATAAWAMGKSGDPRFLPHLGRMLAGSVGQVRKAVFHAIGLIKKATTARAAAPPLHVSILDVADVRDGQMRIEAVIVSGNPSDTLDIPATGFVIDAGGTHVAEYSCDVRDAERVSLALAVPSSTSLGDENWLLIEQAVKSCIRTKRASDQWAVARYHDEPEGPTSSSMALGGQKLEPREPRAVTAVTASYSANPVALNQAIEVRPSPFDGAPGLFAVLRGLVAGSPSGNGAKHLLVIIPSPIEAEESAVTDLIQAACGSRVTVHVLCRNSSPEYYRLCRETKGFYREAASFECLQPELEILCAAIIRPYFLDFTHRGAADCISLDVHTQAAAGKASWRRPDFSKHASRSEVA